MEVTAQPDLLARTRNVIDDALALHGRAQRFGPDTRLFGELPEFDSMAVASLVLGLEHEFDIAIDDDELCADVFATVGTLVCFVAGKLEPRSAP